MSITLFSLVDLPELFSRVPVNTDAKVKLADP